MAATIDAQATQEGSSIRGGWRGPWRALAADCRRWLRRQRRRPGNNPHTPPSSSGEVDALASLRPILDLLRRQSEPLSTLAAGMESAFLVIADCLVELPGASDKLVQHSHQLVAMSSGREGGDSIYQSTYASLVAPIDFVDAHWESTRLIRRQLHESMTAIDGMLRHEGDLARTVAPLKYIQTLFKVESAGLDAAVQGMFHALTEEISGLQRKVSDTFGEKFQVLRDLRRTLAAVVLDLERRDTELGRFLAERKVSLEKTLADLRGDLDRNRQREAKLTQVSQGVSENVGRLVLGLQAQDIVSQKIGHVLEGIERILARPSSPDDLSDHSLQAAFLRFIGRSAMIEQAQLESIREDLRGTEDQLSAAIATIESQSGQLEGESVSMSDFDRITVGYPGLIETLLETIEGVTELVEATVRSTDHAFAEVQPLGGRTSNVTATMRELSAHIHVIALNAQVQAASLDSGTGLEVLAAATNRVAVETGGISEEIANRLDQFATGMVELVRTFTHLHERGVTELQAWKERSGAERQSLHSVRDATLSELSLTSECAQQIQDLVRQMRDKVNISARIDPGLCGPADSLARLARSAETILQRPEYANQLPDPAGLEPESDRKCTMESERKVFEATLARVSGAPLSAAASKSEPAEPASTPSSSAPTEAGPDHISQLAGLAAPEDSNSSAAKQKEFGNNVDLF